MSSIRILFFGDIVGSSGRRVIPLAINAFRKTHKPDVIIANVENLSHGRGISERTLEEMDAAGVQLFTSGNHVFNNVQGLTCFENPRWNQRLVRPANYLEPKPGVGDLTFPLVDGKCLRVFNVLGTLLMKDAVANPFQAVDTWIKTLETTDIAFVDLHAEATSEKEAFGYFVDGRVAAVVGTHTHVPTADARLLPNGTAYITDVGRNGALHSVVGFEAVPAIKKFLNPDAAAYDPETSGPLVANAALIEINLETCRATSIQHLRQIFED